MHLSVAVLKGHDMKSSNSRVFLIWRDGQYEGCGLGGAALATDIELVRRGVDQPDVVVKHLKEQWPWLSTAMIFRLSTLYKMVHIGSVSLEDMILYINQIEPVCGDCCRRICICGRAFLVEDDPDTDDEDDFEDEEEDEYEEDEQEEFAARH